MFIGTMTNSFVELWFAVLICDSNEYTLSIFRFYCQCGLVRTETYYTCLLYVVEESSHEFLNYSNSNRVATPAQHKTTQSTAFRKGLHANLVI